MYYLHELLLDWLRCQLEDLRLSSHNGLLTSGQGDKLVPTKGLPAQLTSETGPQTAHAGQHLLALQLQHLHCHLGVLLLRLSIDDLLACVCLD